MEDTRGAEEIPLLVINSIIPDKEITITFWATSVILFDIFLLDTQNKLVCEFILRNNPLNENPPKQKW